MSHTNPLALEGQPVALSNLPPVGEQNDLGSLGSIIVGLGKVHTAFKEEVPAMLQSRETDQLGIDQSPVETGVEATPSAAPQVYDVSPSHDSSRRHRGPKIGLGMGIFAVALTTAALAAEQGTRVVAASTSTGKTLMQRINAACRPSLNPAMRLSVTDPRAKSRRSHNGSTARANVKMDDQGDQTLTTIVDPDKGRIVGVYGILGQTGKGEKKVFLRPKVSTTSNGDRKAVYVDTNDGTPNQSTDTAIWGVCSVPADK